MKNILLLGASGSIGLQTIDVALNHDEEITITGISVGNNIEVLHDILKKIKPNYVCTAKENPSLKTQYPDIEFFYGDDGLIQIVEQCDYNLLVNALVGFVGLKPTLKAIELKKDVALANKETLVIAGQFVNEAVRRNNVNLIPIDSEHSALLQALMGNDIKTIRRVIITASGGSFLHKTRDELKGVSVSDALKHPNWAMGAKITIDSATMMNKGFEVIEAHWLFDIPYEQIEVLLHPQSIIHSIVEYNDLSQMAQLSISDMRLPIQLAISYPKRLPFTNGKPLELAKLGQLTFKEMDYERFPLLKVCYEVGKAKGNAPTILNAANEIANKAFLDGKIEFLDIEYYIVDALKNIKYQKDITLDEIYLCDTYTRDYVTKRIEEAK